MSALLHFLLRGCLRAPTRGAETKVYFRVRISSTHRRRTTLSDWGENLLPDTSPVFSPPVLKKMTASLVEEFERHWSWRARPATRKLRVQMFLCFAVLIGSNFSGALTLRKARGVLSDFWVDLTRQNVCHMTKIPTNVEISWWNDYRIGDGISQQHDAPGCERYPNSIVCKYTQETKEPNDITALTRVLGKNSQHLCDNFAALHVRLGDGLCAQVDRTCRGEIDTKPDCWNNDADCWSDSNSMTKQYAYSRRWYETVVLDLKVTQVSKVVIIGDKYHWTRTPDPRHDYSVDEEYVANIAHFFRSHGFAVFIKDVELPDTDFAILCSASVFIQGGGGYSALVAEVVKQRGGVVLKPTNSSARHPPRSKLK